MDRYSIFSFDLFKYLHFCEGGGLVVPYQMGTQGNTCMSLNPWIRILNDLLWFEIKERHHHKDNMDFGVHAICCFKIKHVKPHLTFPP